MQMDFLNQGQSTQPIFFQHACFADTACQCTCRALPRPMAMASMPLNRSQFSHSTSTSSPTSTHPVLALIELSWHTKCARFAYLQGLAQAHLVGQDAVEAVVVQGHQPLQPHHLIVSEGSAGGAEQQLGGLRDLFLYSMGQRIVPVALAWV